MRLTRLRFAAGAFAAAVGTLAGCSPASGTIVAAAPELAATTDTEAATLRICHAALALEHNTFVEFDWNTAYESAANMDLDVDSVEDQGVRAAAQAAIDTVPGLLEDEEISDEAFIDAIVPIMSDLYYACDEWGVDHLYED